MMMVQSTNRRKPEVVVVEIPKTTFETDSIYLLWGRTVDEEAAGHRFLTDTLPLIG